MKTKRPFAKAACGKPELLMPAGNLEKLKTAYRFGADACYIGIPDFSLRNRENQVTEDDIDPAVKYANKLGKKIYVTVNTYPHNERIKNYIKHIKFLAKIKPDALIFSDPGVYQLIKKYYPKAVLHLSVQATCTNYETVKFWQNMEVARIILARELSIKEIAQIHRHVPKIELECFVHGAICMAYSGRCLLSNYMTGRDSNQGDCAHPCRWDYKVLEEKLRPGEYFPIYENQHGSHILSSRDICMIDHLKDLYKAGVCSFKIEGRAKNVSYAATITRAYRKAIDDMGSGEKFDHKLLSEVKSVSNRGFFTGFYYKPPTQQDYQLDANRTEGTHDFIGIVRGIKKTNSQKPIANSYQLLEIEVKGQIKVGDIVEFVTPNKIFKRKVSKMYNYQMKPIKIYHPGLKENIFIPFNLEISKGDIMRKKI